MATSSVQPTATPNQFEAFIAAIKALPGTEKDRLSDEWAGPEGQPSPDPLLATFGSAVWYVLDLKKGKGFEEQVIKNLKIKGCATPRETALEFIERYMPAPKANKAVFVPLEQVQAELGQKIEAKFNLTEQEIDFMRANFTRDGEIYIMRHNKITTANKNVVKAIAAKLDQIVDVNGIMVPASWVPFMDEQPAPAPAPAVMTKEAVAAIFKTLKTGDRISASFMGGNKRFDEVYEVTGFKKGAPLFRLVDGGQLTGDAAPMAGTNFIACEKIAPTQPKVAEAITPMEYDYLAAVVYSEYHDGDEVVDNPVWAPTADDFNSIKKNQLGGVASSLQQKGFVNIYDDGSKPSHKGQQTITVAITQSGFEAFMAYKTNHLPAGAPTVEGLEERINDLAKEVKKGKVAKVVVEGAKKGRGYANAGKKYEHSGVRVESFKIGKTEVKKGDKLYFKIGQDEVCGIFSHLNKCVHCPEGYAIIKFNGKAYERRQARVSLTPEIA